MRRNADRTSRMIAGVGMGVFVGGAIAGVPGVIAGAIYAALVAWPDSYYGWCAPADVRPVPADYAG